MPMRRAVLATMCALVLCAGAYAQTHRGLIRGRVIDSAGHAVEGAQVSVTNQATNDVRRVTSDPDGGFALPELPPGAYRLVIGAGGHKMHVEELTLEVNQVRRADVRL